MEGDNIWPLAKLSTCTLPPRSHKSKKWHHPMQATLRAQVESRITWKSSSYRHRTRQPNLSLWSFPIHWLKKKRKSSFNLETPCHQCSCPTEGLLRLSHLPPHRYSINIRSTEQKTSKKKKKVLERFLRLMLKGHFFKSLAMNQNLRVLPKPYTVRIVTTSRFKIHTPAI